MDDKQYKELSAKLDNITKLLSVIALKDKEREQDKIELLDMVGFRTSEIARLLNKSSQNISTVLGILRKKGEAATEPIGQNNQTQPAQSNEQTQIQGETQ
jgi:hypothetical protein